MQSGVVWERSREFRLCILYPVFSKDTESKRVRFVDLRSTNGFRHSDNRHALGIASRPLGSPIDSLANVDQP